jgi:zinc D-Ala-D-Ala dipeptidase
MTRHLVLILFAATAVSILIRGNDLPDGFVYLANVDSSILQSVRYAQPINFVGEVIDGYLAKKIIMTKLAASALSNVQY